MKVSGKTADFCEKLTLTFNLTLTLEVLLISFCTNLKPILFGTYFDIFANHKTFIDEK